MFGKINAALFHFNENDGFPDQIGKGGAAAVLLDAVLAGGSGFFEASMTEGAEQDLEILFDYITEHDSRKNAEYVLDALMVVVDSLRSYPERGTYPRELQSLGMREYRQLYFKPYRVIYRIIAQRVYIYLIADGRRDMVALLSRRLLG